MKQAAKKEAYFIGIITSILVLLDQISKYLAVSFLEEPLGSGIFKLIYSENTGIAFSINVPYWLIIASNIILLALIIYLAGKELNIHSRLSQTSVALILAGGAGNMIDRILHGYVIDFIGIWKWPIFNLADMYITGGVLLIIVFYAKIKRT